MAEDDNKITFPSFWKTNLPTRNLLIVIIMVYLVLTIINLIYSPINNLTDFFSINEWLLSLVGQYNARVFEGHVYLLFTAILVHTNIVHLLSNCLFLIIYGLRVEEKYFSWQYYLIFFLSALLGNLVSLVVFSTETITVGASGGIFGLLGASLVLSYQEDKKKAIWIYLGIGCIFLVLTAGLNVNLFAHAAGLITGIIIPFIITKRKNTPIISEKEFSKKM